MFQRPDVRKTFWYFGSRILKENTNLLNTIVCAGTDEEAFAMV